MNITKYDLLFGGGYSIKDYYMESGNPRQMRGASELLNDCAADVENMLVAGNVEKEHIIKSGATLSAIVPRDKSSEFAKKAEGKFLKKCRTASAAFVTVPYEEGEYPSVKRCAEAKYENRKATKFSSWDFQDAEEDSKDKTVNYMRLNNEKEIAEKAPTRCPRCRIRTPRYFVEHNNGEEQYLCTSCAQREEQSSTIKYTMREACCNESGNIWNKSVDTYTTISDLKDKDNRIALLYADINNLGGQADKKTFKEDKEFHETVDETVINAIYLAIKKAMEVGYRRKDETICKKFEIIALAGDDICLLLPGDVVLLADKTIVDIFEMNKLGLTITVAACVANDTTAISYMERIVELAQNEAKDYAHINGQSTVTLSFFDRPSGLFPLTADELNEFTDLLKKISPESGTSLRNISKARREMKIDEEFNLYFDYCLSRDVKKESEKVLRSMKEYIQGKYQSKKPWPVWYAWSDFVIWRRQKLGGDQT